MRYFIAYGLRGVDAAAVDALRLEAARRSSAAAALRIPPHMTIFPPFETGAISMLEPALAKLAEGTRRFTVAVKGFGSFDGAVWFIDVEQRTELRALRDAVAGAAAATLGIADPAAAHDPYFHVTIAYKDVTPAAFAAIGALLADKTPPVSSLEIDALTLYRHEDDRWVTQRAFPFGRS